MATEVKRMRFFDGLFLKEEEFRLEQEYNIRMRRLQNRHLHGFGIVWGLDVQVGASNTEVLVKEGMAIDKHLDSNFGEEIGREIVVTTDTNISLATAPVGQSIYLYVYYEEQQADVVTELGGPEPIHWLENAAFTFSTSRLGNEEESLLLARIDIAGDGTIDAGSIVYIEDGQELRTYIQQEVEGGTTIIQGGGTGKNYVVNPGADTDILNWAEAASGNFNVVAATASGQVLSGTQSFLLDANASVTADTDYITVALNDLDEEDKNQLFSVEFSYKAINTFSAESLKVVIRDTTNNVDILPNPMKVPTGQGKYRGIFNTSGSLTYELRLVVGESSQAFQVAVDSVIVGPDRTTVGAAIGGWQPYDLEITSTGDAPSKANSPDRDQAYWRRVGDSMEITYVYYHTNSAGAVNGTGAYLFPLPDGYTIDANKIDVPNFVSATRGICGSSSFDNGTNDTDSLTGTVNVYDSRHLLLNGSHDTNRGIPNASPSTPNFIGLQTSVCAFAFRATVPIAEWQTDVILAESRTEYVFNGDDSNQDNTSNFGVGEIGGLVPALTGGIGGTQVLKRCKVSRPYKHYRLEFNPGGNTFWTTEKYTKHVREQTNGDINHYGAYIDPISETEFNVVFQGYAYVNSNEASTVDWAAENAAKTRWRVVASDNPFFLEAPPNVEPGDVGPWTSAGQIVFGSTGNPWIPSATATRNEIRWRRVGENIELMGQLVQTSPGTTGTGSLLIEIPEGLHAAPGSGFANGLGSNSCGSGQVHQTGLDASVATMQLYNDRHLIFATVSHNTEGVRDGYSWVGYNWAASSPTLPFFLSFHATFPIDEWTNSDLVLRENQVEYVYNFDTEIGGDTTSFATGENGGLVPNRILGIGGTGGTPKRCRVSKPYKHLRLEFNQGNNGIWAPMFPFYRHEASTGANDRTYGARIIPITETEFDVFFGEAAWIGENGRFGWDSEHANQTRWRVVATNNPLLVESPVPTQGNVVGPWTDAGPMVLKGTGGTDVSPGSTQFSILRYRRVGESMEIEGAYRVGTPGSNGTGTFYVEIPEGLNVVDDGTLLDPITQGNNTVGSCQLNTPGAANTYGVVQVLDTRSLVFYVEYTDGGSTVVVGNTLYNLAASGAGLSFTARVRIAEWAGEQVVLAENAVEYVANSNPNNSDDTTTFVTGIEGSLVPEVAPPGYKKRRVRFSRPFRHVQLEVKPDNAAWVAAGGSGYHFHTEGSSNAGRGMYILPVAGSDTEFEVFFAEDGTHRGGIGNRTWTDEAQALTRWRVVGADNPLLVETPPRETDVGPWTDEPGGMVWSASGSANPVPETNAFRNRLQYRRVGDSMEIYGSLVQENGGTQGNGIFLVNIPAGLNADMVKVNPWVGGEGAGDYGTCRVSSSGVVEGKVDVFDSRRIAFRMVFSSASANPLSDSTTNFSLPLNLSFHATIPIAEWSSNDIVLSESRVEYVSNDDATNNNDTDSFVNGERGSLVPAIAQDFGIDVTKRVQFSRVHKHVRLEFQEGGTGAWIDVGSSFPYSLEEISGSPNYVGARIRKVNDTEYDVDFARNHSRRVNTFTIPWTTENTNLTRWRVVGSDNPAMVEAPQAQYLAANSDNFVPPASGVWGAMTGNSITLQPGSWSLSGAVQFSSPVNSALYTNLNWVWATANGDNTGNAPPLLSVQAGVPYGNTVADGSGTNWSNYHQNVTPVRVSVSVATTVYLLAQPFCSAAPSNMQVNTYIYAERLD